MNAAAAPAKTDVGFLSRSAGTYRELTGQSVTIWFAIALSNVVLQVVLYREISANPGEFGLLTAALGIIGFLLAPLQAAREAFRLYPVGPSTTGMTAQLEPFRSSEVTVIESAAWVWAAFCALLILIPFPLPSLPRFPLQLLALMNVLIFLGAVVSKSVCEKENKLRFWAVLVVAAALIRIVLGGWLTSFEPWADSGLAIFLLAGFITLTPALRPRDIDFMKRIEICRSVLDRDFLLFAGATVSVLIGLYLFTNADRILSLYWAGVTLPPSGAILGVKVRNIDFDQYQAAGLVGRSLLWGTQPLLWILFAQRAPLKKTIASSLTFFWIYFGALVVGALALGILTQQSTLNAMGSSFSAIGRFGPTFAAVMLPLGLIQGIGIFSLASRRYHECFVLGGCSVVYTIVLALFGKRPDLMLPYMFGTAMVCLMIVLFVGIVRWGRKQP